MAQQTSTAATGSINTSRHCHLGRAYTHTGDACNAYEKGSNMTDNVCRQDASIGHMGRM